MRFQDKVAIITGGSSGIGKEVAIRFVAEGGSVVIIGRDAAKAEAAAKQIDATEKRAIAHVGDISLPATGKAAVKAALDRFAPPRRPLQQRRHLRAEAIPRCH
jgi:NAD(P)-dependent dehydrogenase (short-subunit alcohol dehydrogenase family)